MGSRPRELRALGKALRSDAHEFANRLLSIAADPRRNRGDPVPIPPYLFSEVVLLLLGLPRPQRGRPKMETTLERAAASCRGQNKARGRARRGSKTGENPENVRRRLRSKKTYKPKRKGGT